jgi:uncharacterized membrane protein YoaK (UPF0700 family)
LPGLLILLTAVSGIVDAISVLRLDNVFVANITGSMVFVGLGLAGANGFPIFAPLLALTTFVTGAVGGGILVRRSSSLHRGKALRTATVVQLADLTVCTCIAAAAGSHPDAGVRYLLLGLLATGMGMKTALVRRVDVPGLTTAVITTTLTGLAADAPTGAWRQPQFVARALGVLALFIGAVIGALLLVHTALWYPLALATALLVAVSVWAQRVSTINAPWASGR